jgi:hypothetical protein
MNKTNEYWKTIEEYSDYEISSIGRVRNNKGRILKDFTNDGYKEIKLVHHTTKKRKISKIHRLVALAFLPRDLFKNEVNHKNKIRSDNKVDNLEWTDRSGNMKHIFKDMISIKSVLEVYEHNKNISIIKFEKLLIKKALKK